MVFFSYANFQRSQKHNCYELIDPRFSRNVFEAVQKTHSTCFIGSKTLLLVYSTLLRVNVSIFYMSGFNEACANLYLSRASLKSIVSELLMLLNMKMQNARRKGENPNLIFEIANYE